jgi:hypothetical protein
MTFDWNANWPFLLQVTFLGVGLQNQYQSEYQMAEPCGFCTCLSSNTCHSYPTSKPPHASFTKWSPWPSRLEEMKTGLSFFKFTLLGMGLQKWKWIPNGWVLRLLNLLDNDVTRPVLDQPLHHRIDSFTRNVSRDLQAWRTSCLNKLADLFAGWFAWKKTTMKICK